MGMRISIRKKWMLSFGGVVLLLIIEASGGIWVLFNATKGTERKDLIFNNMMKIKEFQDQVEKLLIPVNTYIVTGNTEERINFARNMSQTVKTVESINCHLCHEERPLLTELKEDLFELGSTALSILSINNVEERDTITPLLNNLYSSADSLFEKVKTFEEMAKIEMRNATDTAQKAWKTSIIFSAIIFLLVFASFLLLYYKVSKQITSPLNELHKGVEIIRGGNLEYRLKLKTGDEIEEIANSFNDMASSLKNKIDEVQEKAEMLERTSRELDKRILELYTLYNISKTLQSNLEVENLLNQIVGNVSQSLKLHKVLILLVDDKSNELYVVSSLGFPESIRDLRIKIGEGVLGWTALTGEAKMISKVKDKGLHFIDEIIFEDVSSAIIVPFITREKVVGLLAAFKREPETFQEDDFELLRTVANHVAIALDNAKLYEETKKLSLTDGLTGLYNYRFFNQRLKEEFKRALRYSHPLSLIILDVDNFKKINDTHGHLFGDEVLKKIAQMLRENARETDFIARYGGDEFVIILPETNKESAFKLAERILERLNKSTIIKDTSLELSVSIGVASYPEDAITPEELIKSADKALYNAKQRGGSKVMTA
jgi:diguanylate cyclase (GGDEF)-like protein